MSQELFEGPLAVTQFACGQRFCPMCGESPANRAGFQVSIEVNSTWGCAACVVRLLVGAAHAVLGYGNGDGESDGG